MNLGDSSVSIRAYKTEDWNDLCVVHDLSRPIELSGSCDPRAFIHLDSDEEGKTDILESTKLIAEVDGRVVGFVAIDKNVVCWLYVLPECAGQGIGKQLLLSALRLIEGEAITYVLSGNDRALNLYRKVGFNGTEVIESNCSGFSCKYIALSHSVGIVN